MNLWLLYMNVSNSNGFIPVSTEKDFVQYYTTMDGLLLLRYIVKYQLLVTIHVDVLK